VFVTSQTLLDFERSTYVAHRIFSTDETSNSSNTVSIYGSRQDQGNKGGFLQTSTREIGSNVTDPIQILSVMHDDL
jgi:hypothetical protein